MSLYQLGWMFRSLGKSLYFGAIVSIILILAVIPTGEKITGDGAMTRFHLLLSLSVDSITTFIVASMGLAIGITVSTWDTVLLPIRLNFKAHVYRALWSVVFSIFLIFSLTASGVLGRTGIAGDGLLGMSAVNMIVSAAFGSTIAFKTYVLYGTMGRKARASYTGRTGDGKLIVKVLKWFVPFVDRSRLWGQTIIAMTFVVTSIYLSGLASTFVSADLGKFASALAYPVSLCFMFALQGVVIRTWDSVKLGKRDRLYPRWETSPTEEKRRLTSQEKSKLDDADR